MWSWGMCLKRIREEAGVSQRRAADENSVNRSTLRRIERDETSPTVDDLENLLKYFGYGLDAFVLTHPNERVMRHGGLDGSSSVGRADA